MKAKVKVKVKVILRSLLRVRVRVHECTFPSFPSFLVSSERKDGDE